TLGLPGIGALGVCFGKLFVMDSPSARKPDTFNWGSTLWHEFTHVITLQITDHKIPRWFSEGLSVYEERKAYPGWGDDLKLDYLAAIKGKKLLTTAELNNGFIRPKYPAQVLVSYYQASLICDYIEQKFGFPAIKRMLALYKAGKGTADVFKEALNLTLEQFDTEFFKWVDDRVKSLDVKPFTDLISSGQQALASGDTDKAIEILSRAVEMYPEYSDEHNAYEPLADAYLKKGNKKCHEGFGDRAILRAGSGIVVKNSEVIVELSVEPKKELETVERFHSDLRRIDRAVRKIIVGQKEVVDQVMISMLTGGHSII